MSMLCCCVVSEIVEASKNLAEQKDPKVSQGYVVYKKFSTDRSLFVFSSEEVLKVLE